MKEKYFVSEYKTHELMINLNAFHQQGYKIANIFQHLDMNGQPIFIVVAEYIEEVKSN